MIINMGDNDKLKSKFNNARWNKEFELTFTIKK